MAASILDVAIVGGGVSGIWSGWRLTDPKAGPARRKDVAVFELSDRIGGRLLSVELPGQPGVACELGGMRYMSTQPLVKGLVEDILKLPTIAAPVAEPQNIAHLRGRMLSQGELTYDPATIPYDLTADERKRSGSLLSDAIAKIAPTTVNLTGDALRKAVRDVVYDGRLLWQQGFWNVVAREMSGEAYRYAQALGGYDTTQLNWNAADTIVLNSDFAKGVTYHRVKPGYEQVPIQLAGQFVKNGGKVLLQHRVSSVETGTLPDGTTGVVLVVDDLKARQTTTVYARSAILALPRRSIELLEAKGAVLGDDTFRALLGSVTPIPLFKAFVAYHEPWWAALEVVPGQPIIDGRSVTDLPLRQVYYWSTVLKKRSMLLATYDDTDDVGFWQGLAVDPILYGVETGHLPDAARDAIEAAAGDTDERWKTWKAPAAMVAEIHRQLQIMHGVTDAPQPYAAIFHDWRGDPFGGGVNFWNIGVKSWEVMAKMVKPVAAAPVHVVGEAYSDAQGWVEGALRTAELVLTGQYGLPVVPPAGA